MLYLFNKIVQVVYMKIGDIGRNTEVYGKSVSNHKMTVNVTDNLFSIMVDGLYQNKIGAVIRELSTNALDAHIDNNKEDIPFEITIPTENSDYFSIRDYGKGLSSGDLIKYFGEILSTSKGDTNNLHGAYGIGCKSPFSVTDVFTVKSYKEGIETVALFTRDGKKTPDVRIISTKLSNKPSGIEMSFRVLEEFNKCKRWLYELKMQLCMFRVKPITNIENVGWFRLDKLTDNCNRLQKAESGSLYICMGSVLYPLQLNEIKNIDKDISKHMFSNSDGGIVYSCKIGDISIPPDRERIEYTNKTIMKIIEIIKEERLNFIKQTLDDFVKNYRFKYSYFCSTIGYAYNNLVEFISHSDILNCIKDNNLEFFTTEDIDLINNTFYFNSNIYVFHFLLGIKNISFNFKNNVSSYDFKDAQRTKTCQFLKDTDTIIIYNKSHPNLSIRSYKDVKNAIHIFSKKSEYDNVIYVLKILHEFAYGKNNMNVLFNTPATYKKPENQYYTGLSKFNNSGSSKCIVKKDHDISNSIILIGKDAYIPNFFYSIFDVYYTTNAFYQKNKDLFKDKLCLSSSFSQYDMLELIKHEKLNEILVKYYSYNKYAFKKLSDSSVKTFVNSNIDVIIDDFTKNYLNSYSNADNGIDDIKYLDKLIHHIGISYIHLYGKVKISNNDIKECIKSSVNR